MKKKSTILGILLTIFFTLQQTAQEKIETNIQSYTPSKLLNRGQWDIKFFNNLYTETKKTDDQSEVVNNPRSNFFTATLDIFTGISDNNRINIGLLLEYRSNTIEGKEALSVFNFKNDSQTGRSGFSSFAPAIKFQPFKKIGNFSIQTAFHIPVIKNESENDIYLDQTAYTFQNRLFYDYNFNDKLQLFTEFNIEYNFGNDDSFANNTYVVAPGIFLSYFPTTKATILGLIQHSERFGNFTQNYTALGIGGKYQISRTLNLETIYTNFVRGKSNGLGQTFNIGLRALF